MWTWASIYNIFGALVTAPGAGTVLADTARLKGGTGNPPTRYQFWFHVIITCEEANSFQIVHRNSDDNGDIELATARTTVEMATIPVDLCMSINDNERVVVRNVLAGAASQDYQVTIIVTPLVNAIPATMF